MLASTSSTTLIFTISIVFHSRAGSPPAGQAGPPPRPEDDGSAALGWRPFSIHVIVIFRENCTYLKTLNYRGALNCASPPLAGGHSDPHLRSWPADIPTPIGRQDDTASLPGRRKLRPQTQYCTVLYSTAQCCTVLHRPATLWDGSATL